MVQQLSHYLNGARVPGSSGAFSDVYNPSTGEVQAQVPLASVDEVREAIAQAKRAQPAWAATNAQKRARIISRFVDVAYQHEDELAELLSLEHGKILDDAKGDLQRGLDVMEFATAAPHLLKGEYSTGVGTGIDVYSMRQPLGVVAGITPFNFPAMIPLWKAAGAIASGNAFILKPSERDPSVPLRLAELFTEAGLPDGILQVVNGDKTAVDEILDHPDIKAVGFVGSTPIAASIYSHAAAKGKRAQCFGGAKNHMVIMPDADMDQAADALIGAAFGSAGERCMAISVAVPVGVETHQIIRDKVLERAQRLTVGHSLAQDSDFGPVVSPEAKERIEAAIARGVDEGAELILDGRHPEVADYPNGFYIGATIFDHVTPGSSLHADEIFGPVLSIVPAADYDAAVEIIHGHKMGNGVAIFTRDGDAAREFAAGIEVGMIGINVPIPVPIAYYTFGGWKASGFGDLNQHGPDAFRFYTRTKTVTQRWPSGIKDGASFVMPTGN
ncbi:CoA-acylating methylmalonate-semialdehyde dehydrogenase [Auritidibacter ignavus]|uniref:methylmalonate-semialdehyde dehydrogenase (CoA acylating) n=1 Tax=Auritidibacter ignavus TaxID=678932 RepID=A0AAJ6DD82_9MICC|nr:CoA-acylating methylmalonate-semialdehyde dehydrogenase [Auritidibacter ignavus]WGH91781.1 CoA-acylating methylmalonate-semialdehyde dehydrogenase [Auritidibacter ignavus]WGH94229.1 CoA-acylating methylmalonate-semialdehyde dehydrogenase [Auritidibacter ignavus]